MTAYITGEESETEGNNVSSDTSPVRQKRSGILKGGRLWKSLDHDKDNDQNDDQRSTTTSDDDVSLTTTRTVRFAEKQKEVEEEPIEQNDSDTYESDTESVTESQKEEDSTITSHRLETPLILMGNAAKTNSAVQQLFNSIRPPPPAIEPQLITSETLRAWDAGAKPKTEEAAVKRVAERNALRCSLLRNEARKKQQPKQETTSLAERIRLLTCDVDDDDQSEEQRTSPAGASVDKFSSSSDKSSDKSYDKSNEKAFGSASSSSSSSTISAPVPTRQPPDLGDMHQETQKPRPEPRRQFLSTLAPLTACVGMDGSAGHHEGFYYVPPGDRASASAATTIDFQDHNESPAPDVVAGTPGASDNDESLAAFARASASRTERIRQRYGHESQPVSSDDEHDDYGFHRRPAVRGIAVKQQLGASDDILQQMQNDLLPTPSSTSSVPAHSCQRTNSNYSWPYYSEANLNSRPQSRSSINTNWSKSDYVTARQCSTAQAQQHAEPCYVHIQNMAQYTHYQHRQQDYRNCTLYANMGCSDSSQELYSSQTSSEPTSPVRNRRPESPPPIRTHHQLLYVPYSNHYHYQQDYAQNWSGNDYAHMQPQYQQQAMSGTSTPQPAMQQRAHYTHALQVQTLCPAPARYRPVPAPQPGGGKQMICYSEKVPAPLYQPAPGSPSRSSRGAPEGAPSGISAPAATSPMTAPQNPVYYAMNV
ncbi:uncharacterized protein LOC121738749 [Aricia agestis]|uniref:uncharacterized protein LOC121738749 n=1 Tax=Aricia agestis TaxID=91739 RepID=UPI001C2036F9|nr:uncharacterized protein LOC121738749 [Aricia agestis]